MSSPLVLILTAAGSSTRMGGGIKKEYLPLENSTVLAKGLKSFLKSADFNLIIITCPKYKEEDAKKAVFCDKEVCALLEKKDSNLIFCHGSDTRQKSVYSALLKAEEYFLKKDLSLTPLVLIHDGARPFVTEKIIKETINAVLAHSAAAPGITPSDTQKEITQDFKIKKHLVRKNLTSIQTPQGFMLKALIECHKKALNLNKEFTDDTEIWDSFPEITENKRVQIVEGSPCNIKITYPQDLKLKEKKMIRVGLGTDLHRLVEGRRLMIGGIEIPSEKGEEGHSDGDVLLHAITDALLGASGLGDIGSYFPPEDNKWKNADSKELLKKVWQDVRNAGWSLGNLDCVIELESPKFLPWRNKVIESIADILKTESCRVFVKAKTNEKLDSVGRTEAVKAYCSCLLEK